MQKFFSLKNLSVLALVVIILGYALFRFWPVIIGVRIHLAPIENNDGLVTIRGTAPHARFLSINDLPVSEDENGKFTFQIASLVGINRLKLYAEDKFGHTDVQLVEWYYNSANPLDALKPIETPSSIEDNNGIQKTNQETIESGTNSG